MLNIPLGDIAALRMVTTAKYISGWIDRIVLRPVSFRPRPIRAAIPGAPALCGLIYCTRGDVADAPVQTVVKGANLERFASARATLLVKPSDDLSVTTTLLYQRIDADGYNAYQQQPGTLAIYQPYDQQEPYYDSFKLASMKVEYDFGFATLTSATSYTARYVMQSEDSTESLQNIFNTTHLVNGVYVANYIQSLYVEDDPTSQFAEELRLTSKNSGALQWVGGLYYSKLRLRIHHAQPRTRMGRRTVVRLCGHGRSRLRLLSGRRRVFRHQPPAVSQSCITPLPQRAGSQSERRRIRR